MLYYFNIASFPSSLELVHTLHFDYELSAVNSVSNGWSVDEASGRKRFVTGSHDETLLAWTWNRCKNELDCVAACRGHSRSVDCISVSPDGSQVQ